MTERSETEGRSTECRGSEAVTTGAAATLELQPPPALSTSGVGETPVAPARLRIVGAPAEAEAALLPKLTRRRLLQVAAGALILGGAGYGASRASRTSPSTLRFRSRPDLSPPPTEVIVPADGTASGLVLLNAARTDTYQHGPMIVDDAGRLVWFAPQAGAKGTLNLQAQTYKGEPALTWWQGDLVLPAGYGQGEYVIAGPDYREMARVSAGNGLHGDLHEFVLTSHGTALFTAYSPVRQDLSAIGGSRHGILLDSLMQEVDIKTGRVLFQWSAAEHIRLHESYLLPPSDASGVYDFFHMNSIDVAPDGNLLISARHTCALYKIHRSTGAVIWRLNGKRSDFKIDRRAKFAYQHHARHHDGNVITVFDDGAGPTNVEASAPSHHVSRGLKLGVDLDLMRVRLLREYLPDPQVLASSQGSVQLLPNGNAFVGWGSQPYFAEYGPGGDIRFDARIAGGSNSYRAFRSRWVGTPAERPAIAVERVASNKITVFASWNGATEVVGWDVMGRRSAQPATTLGTYARDGFETAMSASTDYPYFEVQARDRYGRVIGQSAAVRIPDSGTSVG